jgi:hypothetical protein
MCPAVMGKTRCPLRPESMKLDRGRPEILTPPGHPPACCTQQTITVPPAVAAKTRQKHDYPSKEHRTSCARRTSAGRTFSTIKDPATATIARGWCRLTGLAPSPCGWPACSPSATSASSPPSTPAKPRTPALKDHAAQVRKKLAKPDTVTGSTADNSGRDSAGRRLRRQRVSRTRVIMTDTASYRGLPARRRQHPTRSTNRDHPEPATPGARQRTAPGRPEPSDFTRSYRSRNSRRSPSRWQAT